MDGEASAEKSTSRVASTWKSVREAWPLAMTVRATLHRGTPRVGAAITFAESGKVLHTGAVLACQAHCEHLFSPLFEMKILDLSLWYVCKLRRKQCSGAALEGRVGADGALLRPRVRRRPAQRDRQVALAHALHISSRCVSMTAKAPLVGPRN